MKDPNQVLKQKEDELEEMQLQVFALLKTIQLIAEPGEPGYIWHQFPGTNEEVHETQYEG